MIDTSFLLPCIVLFIFLVAWIRHVHAYAAFVLGVKDGLHLFTEIYPSLLAMLFAVSLLRESGLLDVLSTHIAQWIPTIPSQIWPMVFFRPISGNASIAIMIDIFKQCGVDSLVGNMASIIQGSTDTTLYVITLYFSSVGIRNSKNALSIGLVADLFGIVSAIVLSMIFFS